MKFTSVWRPAIVVRTISLLVVLGSVIVLWATLQDNLDISFWFVGVSLLNPTIAFCFAFAGISLWAFEKGADPNLKKFSLVAGFLNFGIGLKAAVAVFTGSITMIDRVILDRSAQFSDVSALPAVGLMFLGLAMVLLSRDDERRIQLGQLATIAALCASCLMFPGFYLIESISEADSVWSTLATMLTILSAIGLAVARADRGLFKIVTSQRLGGRFVRKAVVPAMAVPILLAVLGSLGQSFGLLDPRFDQALQGISTALAIGTISWLAARSLDRTDESREEAANSLLAAEGRLRFLMREAPAVIHASAAEPPFACNFVSDNIRQQTGYSPSFFTADANFWRTHVHPEDLERVVSSQVELLRSGFSFQEYRFLTAWGYRWFRDIKRVAKSADGDSSEIVGYWTDISEQKLVEEALGESEQRYHQLASNIPGVVFQFAMRKDGSTSFPYVSGGSRKLFGIEPDQLQGDSSLLKRFFRPEAAAEIARSLRASAQHLTEWEWEGQVSLADGERKWLHAAAKPRKLANGDILWDGLFVDLTEHKRSEEVLRQSEERLKKLNEITASSKRAFEQRLQELIELGCEQFDMSNGLATAWQDNQFEIEASHSADPRYERGKVLLRGETFCTEALKTRDVVSIADATQAGFGNQVTFSESGMRSYLGVAIQAGHRTYGTICFFERAPRPEGFSSVDREFLNLIARWIGGELERLAAEAAVLDSQQKLQSILDNTTSAVYAKDLNGRYTFLNRSCADVLGTTVEECVGKTDSELLSKDIAEALTAQDKRALDAGEPMTDEEHIKSRSFLTTRFPLVDATGSVYGVCGLSTDISGLKQAESEAQAARIEAERANAAKSEFLSRMSHELRTPMNSVLGFAQLLEFEPLSSRQREAVDHILKGGRHLLDLINEVLDISRIDSGTLDLSCEAVEIVPLLQDAASLIRPLAMEKNLNVVLCLDEIQDIYIQGDHQRLNQVVINLLSNAVKYNVLNGSIAISGYKTLDGRVQIEIADTGPGIPDDMLSRLFVPFDRLGAERTSTEGTGLGLALSKTLMEAMGGKLEVGSNSKIGATFYLDLAIAMDPVQILGLEKDWRRDSELHPNGKRVVLHIEDNLANVNLIEQVLTGRPWVKLLVAMQGRLGLELAREHHPDLILLDLNLPDIHGHEILEELKATPELSHIPVVVISADATEHRQRKLMMAGAYAFLAKPFDLKKLLDLFDTVLVSGEKKVA